MVPDFDKLVRKLQKRIIKKEIKEHNKKIVNLFYNPINWGKPPKEEITVYEEKNNGIMGYFFGLYLKIENEIIIKANFITDGCGVMVAAGSELTMLIYGKSIDSIENLNKIDLIRALNGVPPHEIQNIELVIEVFKNVIKKYKDLK